MENSEVRLFAEDDPIFSTVNAHLLPKTVRDFVTSRKKDRKVATQREPEGRQQEQGKG